MSRQVVEPKRPNHTKTRQAIQDAVEEVQHAARPRVRSFSGIFSWLVALATGATVALRAFRVAGQTAGEPETGAELALSPERSKSARRRTAASLPTDHRRDASEDSSQPRSAELEKVEGPVGLVKELVARFNNDECSMRAAALAFTGVLSLVPLLLFALAALGFFIHSPAQAEDMVRQIIGQLMPGQEASRAANDFIQSTHIAQSAQTLMKGRWWAVAFGILSLLFSAVSLFVTAAGPMNAAWEVKETRGFVKLRLVALGVFAMTVVLFALSLVLSSGPNALQQLHIPALGLPKHPSWPVATVIWLVFEALAICFNIGMFGLIYKFLPNTKVTWRAAAFGGTVAGILWELFKKGFALYLAHFGNFNKLYGALGSVFLLVTWIYYSCMVLLGGAILCKMYHEHKEEGGVARKAT